MNRHEPSETPLYVVIRKHATDEEESDYITDQKVRLNRGPGWMVFEIQGYVANLIREGKGRVILGKG